MKTASLKRHFSFTILLLTFILILANCQLRRQNVTPQPTTFTTPTVTLSPTLPPLASPLGSDENPLVLGNITENSETANSLALQELIEKLSISTGYTIASKEFTSPGELLNEMEAGFVHAAWLMPLPYIWANQNGFAQAMLLINHFGVYEYGTQFLASTDSGFISYYDPLANQNLADASTALSQFAGQRPCWVSPDSPSGYVVPSGLLAENGITVQPGAFIRDHAAVVRALYVRGICDFGTTFAISGDPRTSPALQDLPDVMNRIVVIWQSDAIIPNMNFSTLPELPEEMQQKLGTALADLASNSEGQQLLTEALNYDVQEVKRIDDGTYEPLKRLIEAAQINLETLFQ